MNRNVWLLAFVGLSVCRCELYPDAAPTKRSMNLDGGNAGDAAGDTGTEADVSDGTQADVPEDVGECGDGKQNGLETDIDCGGGVCGACKTDKGCLHNSDCLSNNCQPGHKTCR